MSKRTRRAKAQRAKAATQPTEMGWFCECGWELPFYMQLRFENPADAPAKVRGRIGIDLTCPECGRVHNAIFATPSTICADTTRAAEGGFGA